MYEWEQLQLQRWLLIRRTTFSSLPAPDGLNTHGLMHAQRLVGHKDEPQSSRLEVGIIAPPSFGMENNLRAGRELHSDVADDQHAA